MINANSMKNLLRKCMQVIRNIFSMLPQQNIILFDSFYGETYSDNPKALYQYASIHYDNYRLIWVIDKAAESKFKTNNIPYVVKNTIHALYLEAVSKLWITNTSLPKYKKPNSKQYVLQTWHGTPLKKVGLDEANFKLVDSDNILKDIKKWSFLIAPNPYSFHIFERAFQINKNCLIDSGYPRNDLLYTFDDDIVIKQKNKLGIQLSKYVILYAPTWRDNELGTDKQKKLHIDLKKIHEAFPDVIILLRLHYLIRESISLDKYSDFMIDVSEYDDIAELYIISDMLITDYSSVFFDYANLRRPMIFFAYDLDEYSNNIRGLYFDYKKVPGPIVKTNDELIRTIEELRESFVVNKQYQCFIDEYCQWEDGDSSRRVWNFLMNQIE